MAIVDFSFKLMETWSNMKLSLDSGFLMACAACDHVQRIWINLLISWHRIEWQVPNVWISWKWEKWNQYHCSFHFGYLFGLDLAIGRPWYRAACKKNALPDETPRIKLQMPGLSVPSATTVPERIPGAGLKELLGRHLMQSFFCNVVFSQLKRW